jgi:hypothetical protein
MFLHEAKSPGITAHNSQVLLSNLMKMISLLFAICYVTEKYVTEKLFISFQSKSESSER